jgi:DNA-binding NarL/FixJ family response regulator
MGILGYVVKAVYRGGYFVSATAKSWRVFSRLAKQADTIYQKTESDFHIGQTPSSSLSGMELQITVLIAKGFSTQQIARKLSITNGTVRNYISAVMRKIGVRNRNLLALFAIQNRLISL